jgi:uncharacterized protein (TIGR03118 family)
MAPRLGSRRVRDPHGTKGDAYHEPRSDPGIDRRRMLFASPGRYAASGSHVAVEEVTVLRHLARFLVVPTLLAITVQVAFAAGPGSPSPARPDDDRRSATRYQQTNLVADTAGVARFTDTNLVNAWGIAESPTSPFWINDNGAGVATLYDTSGQCQPLVVIVPAPGNASRSAPMPCPTTPTNPSGTLSAPTGIVFNGTTDFVVSQGGNSGASAFIFTTEDGTISGWNPTVNRNSAILTVDNSASGAVYKGLALGSNASGNFLFATNFHDSRVDVFDGAFHQVHWIRAFVDPAIPDGFAPFGIANLGGNLYVTYAKQNAAKHDDVAGPGNGFVDVFSTNGRLLRRLVRRGALDSPWGLAVAPAGFGSESNRLLVGNFGDGRIHSYDLRSGELEGALAGSDGQPLAIDGLWALHFGNGARGGLANTLYFTAGPGGEQHGLFGSLSPLP